MVKLFGFLLLLSILASNAVAQSAHSATAAPVSLWAGADVTTFNPDWGCKGSSPFACFTGQLMGPTVFVSADHLIGRFGVDGEARWLRFHSNVNNLKESTYLAGPRFRAFSYKRLNVDLKFLLGVGSITVPANVGSGTYLAVAIGPTFQYGLTRKLGIRGGYEYQRWPSFTGRNGSNGLTPSGFSLGVSYRIR